MTDPFDSQARSGQADDVTTASSTPSPPSRTVTLQATRAALTWARATTALVEAAEREEAEAQTAYDAARGRLRAARQQLQDLKTVRRLVTVGDTPANGGIQLGPQHPDYRAQPAAGKRWAKAYDACRNCGSDERKHASGGRCTMCNAHFRQHGSERPVEHAAGAAASEAPPAADGRS